ncbi:hypothetical protein NIES298_15860 [Microcystis aeruginosa NIES-298]|nr:hypothetical protein NIES298_15860 [Microcystis aeruginosa NIES-298]
MYGGGVQQYYPISTLKSGGLVEEQFIVRMARGKARIREDFRL